MPSHPTRRTHRSVPYEDNSDDDDFENLKTQDTLVRRKSRRSKAENEGKKVRGVRGKLSMLTDMPLDVLFEIFGHLHPFDLLLLARTTKTFRCILMRRSSISIWKCTLSNVPGLPEVPKDMNEPQYVNLMFDKHCHFCLAVNIPEAFWTLRLRCCRKCIDQNFEDYSINQYLPIQFRHSSTALFFTVPDKRKRRHSLLWLKKDVLLFARRLNALQHDLPAQEKLVKEEKKKVSEGIKAAVKYEDFLDQLAIDRSQELDDIRERRKDAIIVKLTELGWGDEIDALNEREPYVFVHHPIVYQPRDLTDRIWSNNQQKLVEFLEQCKTERLARARRSLIRSRIEKLTLYVGKYAAANSAEIIPGFADICFEMKDVRDLILTTPPDVEVKQSSFDQSMEQLPLVCQQWRRSRDAVLRDMVSIPIWMFEGEPVAHSIDDSARDPLRLAVTYFRCQECNEAIEYPRILAHSCMTLHAGTDAYSFLYDDLREISTVLLRMPWNYLRNKIEFDKQHCISAFLVICAAGSRHVATTAAEMDKLDGRYECLICPDAPNIMGPVMTWRMAVLHDAKVHLVPTAVSKCWRRVDQATEDRVKQVEAKGSGIKYRCARCNGDVAERRLEEHLHIIHQVHRDVERGDFFPSHDDDITELEPPIG